MISEQELQIRVLYKETDARGFLHHSNYFVYFEMGRTGLLRAQGGSYRQMEEGGYLMVVVRLTCRYRQPARFADLLTLKTRIKKVGAAKLEHEYFLYRGDVLLAEAESVLGCVDREGNIQLLPEGIRMK